MSWQRIPGRAAYLWIYDEWLESNPRKGAVVVEVGVGLGKSVAYLCERLIAMERRDVEVYAVDPWAGTDRNGEQQELAEREGGDFSLVIKMLATFAPWAVEMVRVVRLPSVRAAPAFTAELAPDLVVIDGAHDYQSVRDDLAAWRRRLRVGGWVGGDDYNEIHHPGVIQAVREEFGDGNYEVRAEQDWPTWLKRGA